MVTNNYRASGGGGFPHLTSDKIVHGSAVENRQVLMDYIIEQKTVNPKADNNWSIAPVSGTNLTFESSLLAKPFADKADDVAYVASLRMKAMVCISCNSMMIQIQFLLKTDCGT